MPRTSSLRRLTAAALLTLAFAVPVLAAPRGGPLGAGRERVPHQHTTTSLWTALLHLVGASGGTFDPNGARR